MVEIWFSILTKQQVRRGVYHDVPELIAAIEHFIDGYNERAAPFVWTKTPDQVLAKAIKRQDTSGLAAFAAAWLLSCSWLSLSAGESPELGWSHSLSV